jgi:hypothetical protein
MTNEEILERFRSFSELTRKDGRKIVEKMALTGQSLIQHRIQEVGVEGASYSDTELPLTFLEGRHLNKKGEAHIEGRKAAKKGSSYKDLRVAEGLQVNHVDLTRRGRMFGGTGLLPGSESDDVFAANIGGSDSEVDALLGYQVDRYGPETFSPNKQEQTEVDEIAIDFLDKLFERLISDE